MIKTLGTNVAVSMLMDDQYAGWSREAATAIVEYLERYEDECGAPIEFDVVAIRCDFTEHKSALEAALENSFTPDENDDEDEQEDAALKWLEHRTTVIPFSVGVVIQTY